MDAIIPAGGAPQPQAALQAPQGGQGQGGQGQGGQDQDGQGQGQGGHAEEGAESTLERAKRLGAPQDIAPALAAYWVRLKESKPTLVFDAAFGLRFAGDDHMSKYALGEGGLAVGKMTTPLFLSSMPYG